MKRELRKGIAFLMAAALSGSVLQTGIAPILAQEEEFAEVSDSAAFEENDFSQESFSEEDDYSFEEIQDNQEAESSDESGFEDLEDSGIDLQDDFQDNESFTDEVQSIEPDHTSGEFEKQRNLLENGLISISAQQIEDVVNLNLNYDESYSWQAGDWFEIQKPEGIHILVLNEILIGAESGFRLKDTGSSYEVYFIDENIRPSKIGWSITEIDEWVLQQEQLQWNYLGLPDSSGSILLLFPEEIEKESALIPEAIGSFNPTLAAFEKQIKAVAAGDSIGMVAHWSLITSAYGAGAQQKVLNKIKEILTKKNLTSLDSRALIEIANKQQCLRIINRYLVEHITYENNHSKLPDHGQTAYSALIGGRTVCAGYSDAFFLLANALQIQTYEIVGEAKTGTGWGGHGWNISLLGNYYYVIDVTWNDPIGGTLNDSENYFLLGSNSMNAKKDHKIDPASVQDSIPQNYYQNRLASGNFSPVSGFSAKLNSRSLANNAEVKVDAGKTVSINLGTTGGSKYSLTWMTTNSGIAAVNDSYKSSAVLKITGKGSGSCEVRIFSPTKKELTLKITVSNSTFTIKYDKNGGQGTAMADTVVKYGTNTTTRTNTYTRPGYIFNGWNVYNQTLKKYLYSADNGSGVRFFSTDAEAKKAGYSKKSVYKNGVVVSQTTNIHNGVLVFKAIWQKVDYQIQYLKNASDATGTMSNSKHSYQISSKTNVNGFKRPGYTFKGWNAYIASEKKWSYVNDKGDIRHFANDAEAAKAGYPKKMLYSNGTSIYALSKQNGDVCQFYAIWEAIPSVTMYRAYNPNSGEHFYTGNTKEFSVLVSLGWKDEGVAWKAPASSSIPVYRLYNKNAGDHHYTLDSNERDALVKYGWEYEGIGWYSDPDKVIGLHRLYNPNAKAAGSHHYTTDTKERDGLVKIGWKYENIGWYGMK